MSWFLATIYDGFMRKTEAAGLGDWRRELLATAGGDVLEVGAGTGVNLPCYGPAVHRLVLTEPDRRMRALLEKRAAATRPADARLEVLAASVERLPFDDAAFDAVVATLVLCSVGDPAGALAEVRRVLRPGGRFYFLEHVASEDVGRLRWQQRIEPLWKRVADNCHLARRTEQAIAEAGFTIEWAQRQSMRKAMAVVRPTVRGVARRPD